MGKPDTPTLNAMLVCKAESQAIGNFLEWLAENGMWVGKYWRPDGIRDPVGAPILDNTETLLARYFEIDLKAAENEKRAIIANAKGRDAN